MIRENHLRLYGYVQIQEYKRIGKKDRKLELGDLKSGK